MDNVKLMKEEDKMKVMLKLPYPKTKEEEKEFKEVLKEFMNKLDKLFN